MKISDILLSFLVKNRRLVLPGLGTFTLRDMAAAWPDDNKAPLLPPGSVEFEQNPSTPEDPELIAEISRVTGKIKPLASSDLETIIIQGKQLLNISKPFHLDGIGSLHMDQRGKIRFEEYVEHEPRTDTGSGTDEPDESIRFGERYRRTASQTSSGTRTLAIAALSLLGLGLLIGLGYYMYQQSVREDASQADAPKQEVAVADTVLTRDTVLPPQTLPPADSASVSRPVDSVANNRTPVMADTTSGFNIILENAPRDRALKRYADLREWGHKAEMTTRDSLTFKIFIPVLAPLSDSARHRDSLSRFFGRKVGVERRNNE